MNVDTRRIQKKTRRIFAVMLAFTAVLCLSACGEEPVEAAPSESTVMLPAEAEAGTDAEAGETQGSPPNREPVSADPLEKEEPALDGQNVEPANQTEKPAPTPKASQESAKPSSQKSQKPAKTTPKKPQASAASADTNKQTADLPVSTPPGESEKAAPACTLSISCATALDHPDLCAQAVLALLPPDGWLLKETTVPIEAGDSVFDILLRTCREKGIPMEYTDTPLYDSAYIEGIGGLYEFDVGELSGWTYSVNGSFPNYGCSLYPLEEGDAVFWVYTCDLGRDVGGDNASGR